MNLPSSSCSRSAASRVTAQPSRKPGAPWHLDSEATETTFGPSATALSATAVVGIDRLAIGLVDQQTGVRTDRMHQRDDVGQRLARNGHARGILRRRKAHELGRRGEQGAQRR